MKRAAVLFGIAALLFGAHVATTFAGWAEHTSVIAGMPRSAASWTIGPLFVLLQLGVTVVAPILLIAATIDTLWWLGRRPAQPAVTRPS